MMKAKIKSFLLTSVLAMVACNSSVEKDKDSSIKSAGEAFIVDSVEYTVDKFYFSEDSGSTELKVFGRIKNLSKQNKSFDSTYFLLEDDQIKPNRFAFNTCLPGTLIDSAKMFLHYKLPARTLPYLKYTLPFREKGDTVKKAQVIFFKSFRSEG